MPGDSLDAVEFFMELEREFEIDLSDSAPRIDLSVSVGSIYRIIAGTSQRPAPSDPTWRQLVLFVARFTGIPADNIGWETQPFLL